MAELSKLGRYELRRVLGKGAMGVVYEGFDPVLNRRVAVKTILKSVALDEATQRDYSVRFVREAQAVGRLNHPHIVQVHDFGEQEEVAYLVMEFIEGRELRAFFDEGVRFEAGEAVRIMRELLDALEFAHEKNVIHRDVKPANVMLDAQRQVKLADFGVARVQDSDRSAAGTLVGTPAFMSPEQISGGKIDRRTDVFSAGVILYQLLTGTQPFTGEGAWTVARKIMQEDPPLPSRIVGSVSPPVFDGIIARALAKKQADRFASAKEFRAALRAAQRGMVAPGAPVPVVVAPVPQAREAPKASETEIEFWRALQNSTDAAEFEFYLEQFPDGTYAPLARHKIVKLRESQDAQSTVRIPSEQKRLADEGEALRREAEAKAKREAEDKALREALEKTKREAAEKAKRELAARAKAIADENATVAIGGASSAQRKPPYALAAVAMVVALAIGVVAYLLPGRTKAPEPVAQAPAPLKVQAPAPAAAPKAEISAAEIEKIKKDAEDRIRREYADKSAAEQAIAAKAAAEKAVQAKNLALKDAAEKSIAEKAASEKLAADKAAAEKAMAAKSAAQRSAAEKAAAEKAVAEKLAAEKAAAAKAEADKLAAEKAAAAKAAAAAKPGWPSVGDRWVYEVRITAPEQTYQATVQVLAVTASSVRDAFTPVGGEPVILTHEAAARLVGVAPGITSFAPYLRAFQELRGGESWPNVQTREVGLCSSQSCGSGATVARKERITVRAGSFDAWRIEIWIAARGGAWYMKGAGVEYVFWYSEAAKRIVKFQSRGTGPWPHPDADMELMTYTPAGAK